MAHTPSSSVRDASGNPDSFSGNGPSYQTTTILTCHGGPTYLSEMTGFVKGTQAWVFRLNPDKLCDPSTASPFFADPSKSQGRRQSHISSHPVHLQLSSCGYITCPTPTHLTNWPSPRAGLGRRGIHAKIASFIIEVMANLMSGDLFWNVTGGLSYHLLRDPQPWRNREVGRGLC